MFQELEKTLSEEGTLGGRREGGHGKGEGFGERRLAEQGWGIGFYSQFFCLAFPLAVSCGVREGS